MENSDRLEASEIYPLSSPKNVHDIALQVCQKSKFATPRPRLDPAVGAIKKLRYCTCLSLLVSFSKKCRMNRAQSSTMHDQTTFFATSLTRRESD